MEETANKNELFGHPKGLFILFFTELWERFSFYGMKAILVLYMAAAITQNGLGWNKGYALWIYGLYALFVYAMSVPGGIIADTYLGQRKSVMVGGFLLCAGHFLLAYPPVWAFFTALSLIIMGVGMLKPNISVMVGSLYEENDPRTDGGFTIFYMGINVGAFLAPLLVGYLAVKYGWHYGFALAGVGMLVGQATYLWGQKYLGDSGLRPEKAKKTKQKHAEKKEKASLTGMEFRRLIVIGISFFIVLVFWGAFEQAGGLMNLYTDSYTDRILGDFEIPTAWFQSLNPFFIILLAPVLAGLWTWLGKRKKDPSAIFKMGLGTFILGFGFIFMVGASMERRDGESYILAVKGNDVKVWSWLQGEKVQSLQGHSDVVNTVSCQGRFAASGSADKTIKVWDLKTGKEIRTINAHDAPVTAVVISGDYILSGSRDETIKAWDLSTGEQKKWGKKGEKFDVLKQQGTVTAIAVSGNGEYLAVASRNEASVWSFESGKKIASLSGHKDAVLSVSVSEDGGFVATGSKDKTVKLWKLEKQGDSQSYKEEKTFSGSDSVRCVVIDPDGEFVACGLANGMVKVWKTEGEKEPLSLKGHQGSVNSLLLDEDGRRIISCGDDHKVKVWDVETGKEEKSIDADVAGIGGVSWAQSLMFWLVLAYMFHTIGELCLSPVALSFITKTAPKHMTSSIMGLYFAVTGTGEWAASLVGIIAVSKGELGVFGGIAVFTMVMGGLLMLFCKLINKIAESEENKESGEQA